MRFIRSLIFNIYYFFLTFLYSFMGCVFFFLPSRFFTTEASQWGKLVLFGMKWIVGIKVEVRGMENLPKRPYIIASKHQSALETVAYWAIFGDPAYILKKELLYLPFFGWNLLLTGCMPIDRSSGTKAMRSMLTGAQKTLKAGRPVIIFPEGTRTVPGADTRYNPGIGLLYEQCGVPVVPVALNSGLYWKKNAFIKDPGTVTIDILPPMPEGLSKREFIDLLKKTIEDACRKITPQ